MICEECGGMVINNGKEYICEECGLVVDGEISFSQELPYIPELERVPKNNLKYSPIVKGIVSKNKRRLTKSEKISLGLFKTLYTTRFPNKNSYENEFFIKRIFLLKDSMEIPNGKRILINPEHHARLLFQKECLDNGIYVLPKDMRLETLTEEKGYYSYRKRILEFTKGWSFKKLPLETIARTYLNDMNQKLSDTFPLLDPYEFERYIRIFKKYFKKYRKKYPLLHLGRNIISFFAILLFNETTYVTLAMVQNIYGSINGNLKYNKSKKIYHKLIKKEDKK